jgi:hypothetical protein
LLQLRNVLADRWLGYTQILGSTGEIPAQCDGVENSESEIGKHSDKDMKKG